MKHYQLTPETVCTWSQLTKVEIIVWAYLQSSDPFHANPTPGPTAIARAVHLDKGGVSKALKSLKSKGLVVDARQHDVDAGQQNVDARQHDVDAGQQNVDARQHQNAETIAPSAFSKALEVKKNRRKKEEKRERRVRGVKLIGPDEPAPIITAIAQVESGALDPQDGLTTPQAKPTPRSSSKRLGKDECSAAAEDPDFFNFVLRKTQAFPNCQSPRSAAKTWIERDRAELWQEYQAHCKPAPSAADRILAHGPIGSATDPWPQPAPVAPMPMALPERAAALRAKWDLFPTGHAEIKQECDRLGITCTASGPVITADIDAESHDPQNAPQTTPGIDPFTTPVTLSAASDPHHVSPAPRRRRRRPVAPATIQR